MNFISFKFNYLENVNTLRLRSVRSQDIPEGLTMDAMNFKYLLFLNPDICKS